MRRLQSPALGRVDRRRWLAFALLPPLLFVLILGAMNPTNIAQTRPDHPDTTLRTRTYRASRPVVRGAVLHALSTLRTYGRRWKVVKSDDEAQLRAIVPVFVFSDDVTVTLHEENGATTVDARSASRVGKGDFGENARHLRQLLSALDEALEK